MERGLEGMGTLWESGRVFMVDRGFSITVA